jgi:hypothetical protein
MRPQDLARLLERVPEKRLRLVELAWECADSQGRLDQARLLPLSAEVETAVDEVRAYTRETGRVKWALQRLIEAP